MLSLIAFGVGYALTLAADLALGLAALAYVAETAWWAWRRRLKAARR